MKDSALHNLCLTACSLVENTFWLKSLWRILVISDSWSIECDTIIVWHITHAIACCPNNPSHAVISSYTAPQQQSYNISLVYEKQHDWGTWSCCHTFSHMFCNYIYTTWLIVTMWLFLYSLMAILRWSVFIKGSNWGLTTSRRFIVIIVMTIRLIFIQ